MSLERTIEQLTEVIIKAGVIVSEPGAAAFLAIDGLITGEEETEKMSTGYSAPSLPRRRGKSVRPSITGTLTGTNHNRRQ